MGKDGSVSPIHVWLKSEVIREGWIIIINIYLKQFKRPYIQAVTYIVVIAACSGNFTGEGR